MTATSFGVRARMLAGLAGITLVIPAVASPEAWPVIGRQGIVQLVLVPVEQATEAAAYNAQIDRLCRPGATCFLNFYTNSTGAPVTMPLPDAIHNEATAVFRRSMKQGAEQLRWSCRLKVSAGDCF